MLFLLAFLSSNWWLLVAFRPNSYTIGVYDGWHL